MTAYTSLLGLALPTQGTLDGAWGDTVNNSITSLIEDAVAGTTEITVDVDVTLTSTNGESSEARSAILLMTGARTAKRTITAPAQSKIYIVVNDTTGGQDVQIVGAGPTTGVTVSNGSKVVIAWNGSDFVEIAGATGILNVADGGTGVSTLTGLVKGNGTSAFTAAVSGTDYAPATSGTAILKGDDSGGFDAAVAGTDYAPATTGTAILKGNDSGGFDAAVSGTDYAPATSGTAILKGDGSGGFGAAASGTDYAPATSGSSILYGNGSGGFSNVTVGAGLQFDAGTLSTDGSAGLGTVTSVAMTVPSFLSISGSPITNSGTLAVSYSGTALPVANGGTGATTLTGLVKGTGTTAFVAAVSGTDYAPATSGTNILKGNGSGGFSSATSGTDYAPATSGTAILKGDNSGGFASAVSGTDYAPATSGTSLLKGDNAGGFANAVSGTDYAPATASTSLLYGDGSGGFGGAVIGSGLSFTAGTLSATGGDGTVTSVGISVPSFLSVANSPVTSSGTIAISLSGTALPVANGGTGATTLTGIVKANGTSSFTAITAPSGDLVGTSDTQTLTSKTLQSPTITNGYTEEVYALSGTNVAASAGNASIQTWTLTANSTLTDSLSSGQNIVLGITAGAYDVTWPTMTWTKIGGGGAAPTLYASGVSWISLWKIGTTLYGSHIGDA